MNELRRKAQDRYLASRAKNLVKKWRQLLVTPTAAAAATGTAGPGAASGAAAAAATDSSAGSGGGSAVSSRVTSPAAVSQGQISFNDGSILCPIYRVSHLLMHLDWVD